MCEDPDNCESFIKSPGSRSLDTTTVHSDQDDSGSIEQVSLYLRVVLATGSHLTSQHYRPAAKHCGHDRMLRADVFLHHGLRPFQQSLRLSIFALQGEQPDVAGIYDKYGLTFIGSEQNLTNTRNNFARLFLRGQSQLSPQPTVRLGPEEQPVLEKAFHATLKSRCRTDPT